MSLACRISIGKEEKKISRGSPSVPFRGRNVLRDSRRSFQNITCVKKKKKREEKGEEGKEKTADALNSPGH